MTSSGPGVTEVGAVHQNVGIYRTGARHTDVYMALGNTHSWNALREMMRLIVL